MKQPKLTEPEDIKLESLISATLRELVFVDHHAEHDQIDDAQTCLVTVQGNLEQIEQLLQNAVTRAS